MKRTYFCLIIILITAAFTGCCNRKKESPAPEKFCDMPSFEEGFEQGVSACYATASEDFVFIAGGCNFPDTPAAEGGKKRYYKGIYRIATDKSQDWEMIGEMPSASAYGANIQDGKHWYIIGGMNENGATNSAYCIDISTDEKSIGIKDLPALPVAIDNLAGTISGNTLYVAGGNADGKASKRFFALDLEKGNNWKELPSMPGAPRVQPVCAATDDAVYVWGGFCPETESNKAIVHSDGIRYDLTEGKWEEIGNTAGKNGIMTLSGGIATRVDNDYIIAEGGVNRNIFLDAISGRYELVKKEEYMYKPSSWYRFNRELLLFNTKDNT